MNSQPKQMAGRSQFSWNYGGWLGSQLGGTVWLLLGAVSLMPHSRPMGLTWLGCFMFANLIGVVLWRRRHSLKAFSGLICLCLTICLFAVVAWATLCVCRPDVLNVLGWSAKDGYLGMLVFPSVIALLCFQEYCSRRYSQQADTE